MINPKSQIQNLKFHWLLLLLWSAIGIGLRFTHLASKSPWTDEFSTLVFSLGNSFRTVALDRAIALDTLLQPLQANSALGASEVVQTLLSETNHPPLYFVLAHWWMDLFPSDNGLVSLWVARSFPALLGAASIPAIFGLGNTSFSIWFSRSFSCGDDGGVALRHFFSTGGASLHFSNFMGYCFPLLFNYCRQKHPTTKTNPDLDSIYLGSN